MIEGIESFDSLDDARDRLVRLFRLRSRQVLIIKELRLPRSFDRAQDKYACNDEAVVPAMTPKHPPLSRLRRDRGFGAE